jgi:GT2 family glycosyltransferase
MTVNVSAVVLCHDQPVSLARVLEQLSKQSVPPSRVLIVDTSKTEAIPSGGFESLKLSSKTNFATAIEAAVKHLASDGYLWILHDDSAPEIDALEKLLREVELSPSLAVVGTKQVDWDNSKLIKQMGLTLTKGGKLFSRVRGEFDQGQHDHLEDVMAVGTAGAFINLEKYRELGGFDKKAPPLAADVDFSIRARLSGGRVAVAPDSRVSHQMLSMNGQRPIGWLGGTPGHAIRLAEFHLALSYASFLGFLIGWLMLIPFAVLNSFVLLIRKRARDVPAELSAAVAAFFGIGQILSSRSIIRRTTSAKLRSLAGLRATGQEVKSSNQRAKDEQISKQLLEAHDRGDNEELATAAKSGFISSGAIWFALALFALNISWFPTNFSVTGSGVIPLSANWLDIFNQAGSSSQNLGLGFEGASDPWVWVLALISAPLFFQPSLAITVLFYLSTAIAFAGVFRLSSLVSLSNPVRIASGLAFALWPALTMSIAETRFSQVLAISLLPWLAHSIAKIARLGNQNPGTFVSKWSEVGISGLLLAMVSASSPALGLTLVGLIAVLGLSRPRHLIALIFTTGLTALWFAPLVLQRLDGDLILTWFLDPGVAQPTTLGPNWTLPFFGFEFNSFSFGLFITVPVIALALVALLTPKLLANLQLWFVAATALAVAFVTSGVSFNFGELVTLGIDVKGLLALFGLALILSVAQLASASQGLKLVAVSLVALIGLAPAAFALVVNPPGVLYSDGRNVPSIIQADADANVVVRTLRLESLEGEISVELFEGPGIKLEQLSTSYQISNAGLSLDNPEYRELGQLVANLVSANGADVISSLEKFGIGYVLVFPKDRDVQMALDSTRGLESIGETDFGQLWKVQSVAGEQQVQSFEISLSKALSLGGIVLFVLLALPTSSIRKRNGKESAIFVDAEENN